MKRIYLAQIGAITAGSLALVMSIVYIYQMAIAQTHPSLATWLIFCIAVTLSIKTYWSTDKHSIIGNIANSIDLIDTWAIFIAIIIVNGKIEFEFNIFEKFCLASTFVILIYWFYSKNHFASNMALQLVIAVAYFPTMYNLWISPTNTESLLSWSFWGVGSLVAGVTSIICKDKIGTIYAGRAFILTVIVIILILSK